MSGLKLDSQMNVHMSGNRQVVRVEVCVYHCIWVDVQPVPDGDQCGHLPSHLLYHLPCHLSCHSILHLGQSKESFEVES